MWNTGKGWRTTCPKSFGQLTFELLYVSHANKQTWWISYNSQSKCYHPIVYLIKVILLGEIKSIEKESHLSKYARDPRMLLKLRKSHGIDY